MIKGIGTDIIKVERVKKAVERTEGFLSKVFTTNEINYFKNKNNSYETLSGFFAAKEALSKALGTGIRGFRLTDIEVCHDKLDKPEIVLSEKIKDKFKLDNCNIYLTISHTSEDAIAFVIIEEA